MGLFDFLPSGLGPNREAVPAFLCSKDAAAQERQVQSLLYLFRRLRINRLSAFSQGGTLKYSDDKQESVPVASAELAKWDAIYGKSEMETLLLAQKERVLIDWPKNKFRSLCVLLKEPVIRPASPTRRETASQNFENGFPSFRDYKDRKTSAFAFSVIPIEQQLNFTDLAFDLARLNFYMEHHSHISFTDRIQTAKDAIRKCVRSDISSESMVVLSKETHARLISEYLSSLAFIVQLLRIYDLYTKQLPDQLKSLPVKLSSSQRSTTSQRSSDSSSRPGSPVKVKSRSLGAQLSQSELSQTSPALSPKKSLSPRKSIANLRAPRLSSKPSISNFQANEIYNPVAAPPSPERRNSHMNAHSSLDHLLLYDREIRPELWDKCKHSIEEKLKRELAALANGMS